MANTFTLFDTGVAGLQPESIPQEAQANFRLAHATAHFQSPYSWVAPEAVDVLGGSLHLDFSRQQFSTQLQMQGGERVGSQNLAVTGAIGSNGQLQGAQSGFSVLGKVTNDKQEAAYAFEKAISNGSLVGATLWGR